MNARGFVSGASDVLDVRAEVGVRLWICTALAAQFQDAIAEAAQERAVV